MNEKRICKIGGCHSPCKAIQRWRRCFILSPLALSVMLLHVPSIAAAEELWFPPSLLGDVQSVADLSQFQQGGQMPGRYQVDIVVNENTVANRTLSFITLSHAGQQPGIIDKTGLMACLSAADVRLLSLRPEILTRLDKQHAGPATPDSDSACLNVATLVPEATTYFDFQRMRLALSIPQASLLKRPHGWIPPEQWDEGIPAILLNYNASGSDNRGRYGNSRSHYLRLSGGVNLGAWRLRDDMTWNGYHSDHYSDNTWQHGSAYAERDIIPLRSRLTVGDATTDGDIFDSMGFRGARLMTDDSMFPDSQRGYAPIIRGTAVGNARVTVRQNGYEMYRMNVAPGPFVIDDLYPMYASGDLEVTVAEADGTRRVFTVPYSSVPLMLRQGRVTYAVTAGQLRSNSDRYEKPTFMQSTLAWGLPHNLTAYGGLQIADHYRAGTLGAGFNMGLWGAISADVTHANSQLADGSHHEGQSLRFLYARSLNELGTTFQLTGYRYSTQGFHTLDETALKGMSGWLYDPKEVDADGRAVRRPVTDYYNLYDSKRQRIQANISQRLGDVGSLYLTGSRQTYWNRQGASESLQAGFSGMLGTANYSISYNQTRNAGLGQTDRALYLSLSVPLERWLPSGSPPVYATLSGGRDGRGNTTQQLGLSGSALEQNNLSWNVSQGHSRDGGNSSSASLYYLGGYGNANLGYSHSDSYSQTSYGVSGGMVLHRNGLTLSQPLGDTSVLVAAPGAANVPVGSGGGVKTDWRGYTVMPYASVYRENRIALDTTKLDDRTEIDNPVSRVVPTRGAIVRAEFKARNGLRALITLMHQGKPLPFGTSVSSGDNGSIVGDEGQVFLSGLSPKGTIKAQWGQGRDEQCTAHYQLPEQDKSGALIQVTENCK
ncbi:fimbria/pilus outer membrane usher protein [Serratia marcescens]|uniref:fimbria/pilus outer membrane usher protein n=1 Tax=Serratia marcescens TaxID=615 RepID=UPI0038BE7009